MSRYHAGSARARARWRTRARYRPCASSSRCFFASARFFFSTISRSLADGTVFLLFALVGGSLCVAPLSGKPMPAHPALGAHTRAARAARMYCVLYGRATTTIQLVRYAGTFRTIVWSRYNDHTTYTVYRYIPYNSMVALQRPYNVHTIGPRFGAPSVAKPRSDFRVKIAVHTYNYIQNCRFT